MRKIVLRVTLLFIVIGLFATVVLFAQTPDSITLSIDANDLSSTNDLLFGSNNYTQKDDLEINTKKGSITDKDRLVKRSPNGLFELYVNKQLGIFKVKNTQTEYVYYSGLDEIDDTSSTSTYAKYLSSSIVLYYYKYSTKEEKVATDTTMITMTNAKKLTNSQKEEDPQESYNYTITSSSDVKLSYEDLVDGMKMTVTYPSLAISLSVYVTLSDEGLKVLVPDNEISEDKNLVASIVVFPTIGATYKDITKGYLVVPDGSGALIRYGMCQNTTQQSIPFFGSDIGIKQTIRNTDAKGDETLNLPIFGFVNGIKQDAVYGIVNKGVFSSDLVINPSGALNIHYNYMTPRFNKRVDYLLYGVNKVIQSVRDKEDIETLYRFLSDDDATYVGIANDYKHYLESNDAIKSSSSDTYKTRLDFLMSEVTTGIIGNKIIEMTSVKSARTIIDELHDLGLDKLTVVLKGWNKSGFSQTTPYKLKYNTKCGSKSEYKDLISYIESEYGNCYLYNDYVRGYNAGNISLRKDVARSINNLKMTYDYDNHFVSGKRHNLYPSSTYELIKEDINKYQKLGINSILLDSIGEYSYSYSKNNVNYNRFESISYYDKALNELSKTMNIALSNSNSYFFKYLDDYLDIPMYSSGYTFYTDCVPLIHYVLRGNVDYYSDFVNFQANGTTQLLRMLDFGAFPSYILTYEASFNLKYTLSNNLYTTKYTDFKEKIIRNNEFLEKGFNQVISKDIASRDVLESGVVLITYTDNTKLVINYGSSNYTYQSNIIGPNNYKVIS